MDRVGEDFDADMKPPEEVMGDGSCCPGLLREEATGDLTGPAPSPEEEEREQAAAIQALSNS